MFLFLKDWKIGVIALLSIGLTTMVFYHKSVVSDYQLKMLNDKNSLIQSVMVEQEKNLSILVDAINETRKYNEKIRIDADSSTSANVRLHKTIDSLNTQVSALTEQARIDYHNTLTDILKDCTTNYSEMARKADEHASDAKLFFDIYKGSDKPNQPREFRFR